MKKILQNILIFGLIFTSPSFVMAENAPTETIAPEVTSQASILARKQKAGADLRVVISKMNIYVARTQTAIDRLAEKGIDLADTEEELTITSKSLLEAKVNLEKFSKIQIPENNFEKTESDLKYALKKVEDNLKDARTHLLQSLADLKDKIDESIKATSDKDL